MKKLRIVVCEIAVRPGDFSDGSTLMFCNVIIWAELPQEAEDKIRNYLATFDWSLIEAAKNEVADGNNDYGEEFNELLAQAEVNPNAIILGRFYTYKPM